LIILRIYLLKKEKKKKRRRKRKRKKPQAVSGLPYPFQAVHFIFQSKKKVCAIGQ
jgi:hypothetical protein